MFHLDHTLLQIYRLLSETSDISAALPKILDLVIQDTHAERGQIELYNEKGETLFLQARKNGVDIEDRRESKISRKILAWVRENNAIVLSADARQDECFRDSATVWGHNILSVVCAPMRDEKGIFGILYLDHHNREVLFNERTKDLLGELAGRRHLCREELSSTVRPRIPPASCSICAIASGFISNWSTTARPFIRCLRKSRSSRSTTIML